MISFCYIGIFIIIFFLYLKLLLLEYCGLLLQLDSGYSETKTWEVAKHVKVTAETNM